MKKLILLLSLFFLLPTLIFSARIVVAEEGMWLYTNPPTEAIKEKFGFNLTPEWLEHLQKASVRFGNGGSASFVSADGLVMTNHHVAVSLLEKISTPEHDYVQDGYFAQTPDEELKCPDIELNILQKIEDVTVKVHAAVRPGMNSEAAEKARRTVISEIETEASRTTGFKCTVVTFFQGGLYHLHHYKKYTDVRLVFAPESAIGFFGGDPDNYEYPRYCLDVSFFRAYEDDAPAKIEHYLKWSANGAAENELTFVSGHPGRTDRLLTVAHLRFMRDVVHPYTLEKIFRKEVIFKAFAERSAQNTRKVHTEIFRWTNYRKRYVGILLGLQDASLMQQKEVAEVELRRAATQKQLLDPRKNDPWNDMENLLKSWETIFYRYDLVEVGEGFNSQAFQYARKIVRLVEESRKPNADRLPEYQDTMLDSLKRSILDDVPVHQDVEILKLTDSLGFLTQKLGADHPLVKSILAGKSPRNRAVELIQKTTLYDPEKRKALIEGGASAVLASDDPMIKLVLLIDPSAREYRKFMDDEVNEPMRQIYAKIADARFRIYGTTVYPDATFTLRLSYGQVKGDTEADGTVIPATTDFNGLYLRAEEHDFQDPFRLPESWMTAKNQVNLSTPMNFISTHDIVGGNSGSPVVNTQGEVVGLVFDGNVHSLVLNFIYDSTFARTVSVHSSAIMEALKNVYHADRIVEEITRP